MRKHIGSYHRDQAAVVGKRGHLSFEDQCKLLDFLADFMPAICARAVPALPATTASDDEEGEEEEEDSTASDDDE